MISYVQRIDGNGQPMWELNGIPVFLSEALQSAPRLVPGDADSFYVVWWEVIGLRAVEYHGAPNKHGWQTSLAGTNGCFTNGRVAG